MSSLMGVLLALCLALHAAAASTNSDQGSKQAIMLEIYGYNTSEFSSISSNFSKVVLDVVYAECRANMEKCKPVTSTEKVNYKLRIVAGYPRFLDGIDNRYVVAFYIDANDNILPVATLYSIVSSSKSRISNAIGFRVGETGHFHLTSNTAPPTGTSSLDKNLLTILGAFLGIIALTALFIIVICVLGQKANNEPKPREFTNEVIGEEQNEDVPPGPRQNVWSNKGAKA